MAEPRTISVPLAERMRPRTLDEIAGQDQILGPDAPLGRILRAHGVPIPSILFWGPPGTGKTTIAKVLAENSNYRFVRISGVLDGVKEIRAAVEEAQDALKKEGRPTLALVDEIHRFNRAQQDAFLPHVESGVLTLIGQTTENVSFRIRGALLSRMQVVALNPLAVEQIEKLLDRAIADPDRGLGKWNLKLAPDARHFIARIGMGDARRALNALEWISTVAREAKLQELTLDFVTKTAPEQPPLFDQEGDFHYDMISAFIKSMRGSDPDAALYYMLRALEAGEDPLFITRRMIIFASEDASCDPRALEIALNVDRSVERLGMPEARIPMAHGVVYLSSCSKSNASYRALRAMEEIVQQHPAAEIPRRLRNAPTDLMRQMGNSIGYRSPHDTPEGFLPQRYLPEELGELRVYHPTTRGLDAQIRERLTHYDALIAHEKKK